ncbi:MAG TPA: hypothetical protein VFN35_31345, partial [Ktedonobacteraceae bacterium]|nr:hypothetical protein [Ktedonobacteraceae bacterium]
AQIPSCPVCRQSDQVQTMQAAYQQGIVQMPMPSSTSRALRTWTWIIAGAVVIVCAAIQFLLFDQVSGPAGFQSWPPVLRVAEVVVALLILAVLAALSLLAFRQLVKTNQETEWHFPVDEQQGKTLSHVYYCAREGVIFDAKRKKVLPARAFYRLLEGARAS